MRCTVTRRHVLRWFAATAALTGSIGVAHAKQTPKSTTDGTSKDLSRLRFPDDTKGAVRALNKWLTARGFECKVNPSGDSLQFKHGVLFNLFPAVAKDDIDRLIFATFYKPKNSNKDREALEKLAGRINLHQSVLTAYVTTDQYFGLRAYLTFWDELTAREFDAFAELVAQVVRRHALGDSEALKLLT